MNDLLLAAAAWATRDDWGVECIYLRTLSMLAEALRRGATAGDLVAHANHLGRDCCATYAVIAAIDEERTQ